MIRFENNFIIVDTINSSLVFEIKDFFDKASPFNKGKKYITQFYYGFKQGCPKLENSDNVLPSYGACDDYNSDHLISSSYGNGNQKEPLLLIDNNDKTYINRFFYKTFNIHKGSMKIKGPHTRDVLETLEIIEVDETVNLELHHHYSILKNSDVIISKKEIVNKGDKECNILRLFSLELPIKSLDLSVETFDGSWLYERNRHISRIQSGIFAIDSKLGGSSHRHNPYIQVRDNNRDNVIYGFNLIYSGNHKEQIEINPLQYSTVMIGINDFGFSYRLAADASFMTPEAIFTIKHNQDELTYEMHEFVNKHIIDPKYIGKSKPILFNNWEGTGMKIDEKSLLDMAVIAKKTGVEQFVVDDGWFKNRVTDNGGLGDWSVDLNKFPDGLLSFVNKVKSLGLKFGIWVEPEMICINSDLFKIHPEYACLIPNREPIERRHQLMIDMSNKQVVDYLFKTLSKVFDEIQPDYIKWDYNRFHTEMYSSTQTNPGEFLYKTIFGSYDLFDRLTNRYPNTLFEGCSSGGGRFDLGMLYYTPQIWGSDDTNTYCRSFITCGTLTAYPQHTFGAHVSRDVCLLPGKDAISSLEDRFNLNCVGAFGYEFDFRSISEPELDIIAKQIEFYKAHRDLLQNGHFYMINNCFDDNKYFSYCVVDNKQEEAILFCEETQRGVEPIYWKIKGINPKAKYLVKMREQYNLNDCFEKEFFGSELIEKGLFIGTLSNTSDMELYPNGVFTRLFFIKAIK